jgi:2-hydroxy-6-oxonona-2,4-dienedioate hydrolase
MASIGLLGPHLTWPLLASIEQARCEHRPAVARGSDEEAVESVWSDIDGVRVHARRPVGCPPPGAPTVVLVHGLGLSGRYMVPTLLRLAATCSVWAPDLPGFGASTKPRSVLTAPQLADALADWMTTTGLHRAVLVGNSLGCQVIARFAGRHAGRMIAAVLVSPTMDPGARGPLGQVARLLLDAPREKPPLPLIAVQDYLHAGPLRTWRTLRLALLAPVRCQYAKLRGPALVVRGERDPVVSQGWAEEVTRLLPNGRLVVIPGAPHAVNFGAPAELADAIQRLLGELDDEDVVL